jgi:hypothetical protein
MFDTEVSFRPGLQHNGKYKCTAKHKHPDHPTQENSSSYRPAIPVPLVNSVSPYQVETVMDDDSTDNSDDDDELQFDAEASSAAKTAKNLLDQGDDGSEVGEVRLE